jgi:hypothetical protein
LISKIISNGPSVITAHFFCEVPRERQVKVKPLKGIMPKKIRRTIG